MHVVDVKVQIHGTERGIRTEIQGITTHVRVREDILITHIGIGEADTGLAGVHRNDRGVGGRQTELEEVRRVIRDDEERMLTAVVVTQHKSTVGLGSPRLIGVAHGVDVVHTVGTHTIYLLYVVPLAQLAIEGEGTVVLYSPFRVTRSGFLGGDQDDTVARAATVEGCCSRTFEDRHRLDVIRVNGRDSVT